MISPRLDELHDRRVRGVSQPRQVEPQGSPIIINLPIWKPAFANRSVSGESINLADIPDVNTKVIMLTPLFAGEVDLAFLRELSKRAPVGMDIQGFVRVPVEDDLIFQPWADLAEG